MPGTSVAPPAPMDPFGMRDEFLPLRIEVRPDPARERVVLAPRGEVDVETAAPVRLELAELRAAGWRHVVFDTRQVTFFDSTALRVLLEERRAAQAPGRSFSLIDGSPSVARALEISGLSPWFSRVPE